MVNLGYVSYALETNFPSDLSLSCDFDLGHIDLIIFMTYSLSSHGGQLCKVI